MVSAKPALYEALPKALGYTTINTAKNDLNAVKSFKLYPQWMIGELDSYFKRIHHRISCISLYEKKV